MSLAIGKADLEEYPYAFEKWRRPLLHLHGLTRPVITIKFQNDVRGQEEEEPEHGGTEDSPEWQPTQAGSGRRVAGSDSV